MQPHTIRVQRHGRPGRSRPIIMQKNNARKPVSIKSPAKTSKNPLIAPNSNASAYQGISLPSAHATPPDSGATAAAARLAFSPERETADCGAGTSGMAGPSTGISIEPAARFAPQPARIHHSDEQRTGPVLGIAQAVVQHAHDVQANVQADEVGQGERTHGVVQI